MQVITSPGRFRLTAGSGSDSRLDQVQTHDWIRFRLTTGSGSDSRLDQVQTHGYIRFRLTN
jgi:hypothetical protein